MMSRVTVLCEGTQGHLTGAAIDRFGLAGDNQQVWALGVKEVWKVARPLDRVIHTMGWPLRNSPRYREFGGSFIYPLGADMVSLGMVVGLDYRDAELSVHDLLQELKTHPLVRRILEGGVRGGASWRKPRDGARHVRRGGPRELHLGGPAGGAQHAPGIRPRLLAGRRAGGRDDRDEGSFPSRERADGARRGAGGHRRGTRGQLSSARRQ